MPSRTTAFPRPLSIVTLLAALVIGVTLAYAAEPDPALSGWLGKEITIDSTTLNDHVPFGGKLTFVSDAEDNVVRVCTRNVTTARGTWRMDLAPGCNVALQFTRGTRYCTVEDVRAGNAEVLSSCHRLRSQNVAMHPAIQKGAVELHDVMIFLIEGANNTKAIQILIDSPARVTHGGNAGGHT
jgi:hypothetical protein